MKPEDLKSPFSFDERKVLIQDKIFFVPDYYDSYDSFQFPGFADSQVFGNHKPIFLEYCSGNGKWIAGKALAMQEVNFLACEIKFPRVRKIWSKIKNFQLPNLFAICGEGFNVTKRYFPDGSIDQVFINFPDPWPKKRHHKHRIIQEPFLQELSRILTPSGKVTFVTDDEEYSLWTIDKFLNNGFSSLYEAPYFSHEFSEYGSSYFDELWREKGRLIRYHQFFKKI